MALKSWKTAIFLTALLELCAFGQPNSASLLIVKSQPPAAEREAKEKALARTFEEIHFEHLGAEEGLSQGMVTAILQDHLGYMWFGTKDGLNHYDGRRFIIYRHDPSDSTSLSDNYVFALFEDSKNRLWVGTREKGLNLFDREENTFQHFKHEPGNSHSLSSNSITVIAEDTSGALWIGTKRSGLNKLTPQSGQRDKKNPPAEKPAHRVTRYTRGALNIDYLLVDRQGALWVTVNDPFTNHITTSLFLEAPDTAWTGEASQSALQIEGGPLFEDSRGAVWIMTGKGMARFDRSKRQFILYPLPDDFPSKITEYFNLHGLPTPPRMRYPAGNRDSEAPGDLLWFSSYAGGYYVFETASETYLYVNPGFHEAGRIQGYIESIYRDRGGILWMGSNGYGLYKFDPKTIRFAYPDFQSRDPLKWKSGSTRDHSINSILKDRQHENRLWYTSVLLFQVNRDTGKSTTQFMGQPRAAATPGEGYDADVVAQDHRGNLWLTGGEQGDLICIDPRNRTEKRFTAKNSDFESIRQIYIDRFDNVWCVVDPRTLLHLDQTTEQFKRYDFYPGGNEGSIVPVATRETAPCFYQDENSRLWIGTFNGLFCFDPQREAFIKHYRNAPGNSRSLSGDNIFTIAPDSREPQRYLWIGTAGFGLNRFDRETESFKSYTEAQGLPSNTIYGILPDDDGNLWMSTNRGLAKFNPQTGTFRIYTVEDGLQNNEFNRFAYHKAPDGEMFFGGVKGLNSFYPEDIRDDLYLPPLVITNFQYSDPSKTDASTGWTHLATPVSENPTIELSYQTNAVSFEFNALDYSNIHRNRYAYMMQGLNRDWIYCGSDRKANFSFLPPGEYVFRVKGANGDGIWNETGASVRLIIHPPWWRTGWAYTIYGLLILGLLYILRRYELNRQQWKHGLELEKVKAEKLKDLDRMKSRFFANISHEFRTPLTLILGPIEAMDRRISDPEARRDLSMMRRNGQRLLRLINQLLDLSRLEAGKLKLQARPGDLLAFLKGIVFSFESLAKQRKIDLRFQSPENLPPVCFDPDKLEKVLVNLLSNAFKFTPAGGEIIVAVSIPPVPPSKGGSGGAPPFEEGTGGMLEIRVRDTGPGISPQHLPHIFDRFYSSGEGYSKDQQGSGIGLALTRELVELHHGKISVNSEAGRGAEFTILLPLGKGHLREEELLDEAKPLPFSPSLSKGEAEAIVFESDWGAQNSYSSPAGEGGAGGSAGIPGTGGESPILLIVEDNPDMRAYIRSQLLDYCQVLEAEDGQAGLDIASDTLPDLIISDVMMPKMDGYQLCERLKTDQRTSHIPVILLTAKSSGESKLEGLALGADDYLVKPFDSKELRVRVKNLIGQRRKLRERFGKEIKLQPKDIAITSADEKFLHRAMDIIDRYISDENFSVEQFGREIGLSRGQLHRKLKALTDQSPVDFIRAIRLKRAAQLLEKRSGTVAEIAYQVGFSDPSYFSRCFRQQFGVLPSEFAGSTDSIEEE
ncbi:MAG: response regulator [Calditrichaceae bacterium]|nr:response regulator [Calditrichia bacterium]NUQ42755.1 response regulator [Calditrichaceae bacterium]